MLTSITSHNYHFFFLAMTFEVYSLSTFQLYNPVLLTAITMLYIRSPKLTHLTTKFEPFNQCFFHPKFCRGLVPLLFSWTDTVFLIPFSETEQLSTQKFLYAGGSVSFPSHCVRSRPYLLPYPEIKAPEQMFT